MFPSTRNQVVNLLDPAEVAANRRGELTAAQKARLNQMVWGNAGGGLIGLVVIAVLIFIFAGTVPLTGSWIFLGFLLLIIASVGIPLLIKLWGSLQHLGRLQRDKAAGMAIRQSVGELGFDRKRRYFVHAGERDLILPAAKNIGGLLPGLRYTVFYLEETGFVLSAEQLGAMSEPAVKSALQTVLMQANRFSEEDLQANRQGEVASSQRTRVLTKSSGMLLVIFIPLLVAGFVFLPLSNQGLSSSEALIPLLFIGGMAAIFLAVGLYSLTRAVLDMLESAPEVLKGTGRKHSEVRSSGKSRHTYYYYIIGGTRFQVTQEAYAAFIDDLEYNVYFLPRTKTLLAIEPIDVPDNY